MRVCVAQTKSFADKVEDNIINHIKIIEASISLKVDLIIFPELSITNYEPALAKKLATTIDNPIFEPLKNLSDNNNITIGIGMPSPIEKGIGIGMFIFKPNQNAVTYLKQYLHTDELPFFEEGSQQVFLDIEDEKLALGICYESLLPEHFIKAKNEGADIYIASVAKSRNGVEKALSYFPKIAKKFNTPILMANCIGNCDNFLSVGQSSVWDANGKLLGQLKQSEQGILIYDTKANNINKVYF